MLLAQAIATVGLALTVVGARSYSRAGSGGEIVVLSVLLGVFCSGVSALACIFASHRLIR